MAFAWTAVAMRAGCAAAPEDNAEFRAARKARDAGEVEALRDLISSARNFAEQQKSAAGYQTLAQFDLWLCEVGHARNDGKLIKQAAQDGAWAAERAIALASGSSEAHRLEGESLGQLIPYVFAGGPRYGPRSTREIDKAIELDPKNVNAFIARAFNYFFAPKAFGGDKEKSVQMLKKAVELDPTSDTARLWLAQVYWAEGKKQDALREINVARQLNPGRAFTQSVYRKMTRADAIAAVQ
jgi:cytochrome c-type biogenesis protein CcmH/NrfG